MKRFAMRRLFTLLALPLLMAGLTAVKAMPDAQRENLLGPVRSVDVRMTRHFGDEAEDGGRARQLDIVTYDSKGDEIERTIYDDFGYIVGKQVIARDADGQVTEKILADPEGKVLGRESFVYAGGRLAEIVHRDGEGKVGLRQVSTYGEDGLVREEAYHYAGKPVGRTVYRYDSHGRGSEVLYYMADGAKAVAPIGPCLGAHRMTYEYDGKGRPAKVVAYEPDGSMKKSWQYSYNDKGDIAEERREDSWSLEASTISYEYDPRGNWIRRVALVNDVPKPGRSTMPPTRSRLIHSRRITYH